MVMPIYYLFCNLIGLKYFIVVKCRSSSFWLTTRDRHPRFASLFEREVKHSLVGHVATCTVPCEKSTIVVPGMGSANRSENIQWYGVST